MPRDWPGHGVDCHYGVHRPLVPDLQAKQPSFFNNPLTGTVEEIAAAMSGYAELGVQHIMFQCEPYSDEARKRLTEALQLYRGNENKSLVAE